ncbi:hypothetical protein H4Q26_006036 [Puccinia striiformis f. sp. tritici PST-130]|nr:hypothetical protein H4Q26_006036 [Puccinia striiformis f. sp. tritici PST-130]
MASLKNQLASLVQSNPETGRLKNLSRRDSYIYSPSQAAKLTIDQVHQIGVDGFHQISLYNSVFQKFNQPLFGEASKRTDRTLLEPDEAKILTNTIEEFLIRLSPYLLTKPSAHVLEWLIRRFRIHEFDVAALKSRTGLPQKFLIDAMITSPELLRFVTGILPAVVKHTPAHQALLGFHLHTFLGLFKGLAPQLASQQAFPQPILVILLPVLVDGVQSSQIDTRLTHLIIISALARLSSLPRAVLQNLVKYIIEGHPTTDSSDSSKSCHVLSRVFKIDELLSSMCGAYEVSAFWKSLIQGLVKSTLKSEVVAEELLVKLAQLFQLPAGLIETLIAELLSTLLPMEIPHRAVLRPLGILFQRHPNLVEQVSQNLISTSEANAEESIPRILRLLSGDFPLTTDQCDTSLAGLSSSSAIVRQTSLKSILEQVNANASDGPESSSIMLTSAIKTSLNDPDPVTSELLLSFPQAILKSVKSSDIMDAATSILCSHQTTRSTLKHWLSFLCKVNLSLWSHEHDKNAWKGTILEGIWPAPIPEDDPESRTTANENLLDGIGQNILKRGDPAVIALLQKLRKVNKLESPTTRLVPLLLLWKITPRLSGGVVGALMSTLIDYMAVQTDSSGFNRWVNMDTQECGDDRSIMDMFYSKTSSEKLFSRLTASILTKAAIEAHKLNHPEYCWFEPSILKAVEPISSASAISQPSDIKNLVALRRDILKQEWLTFLARVWTSSLFNESFRVVALLDAEAEIKAFTARCQTSTETKPIDYQILIPSLMIALIDPRKSVRSAALSLTATLDTYLNSID